MKLLKQAESYSILKRNSRPIIHCKVLEDSAGALEILEMARIPKICPRMKHINNYYHHFHEFVDAKKICLHATVSENQKADILTTLLSLVSFIKHWLVLLKW